MTEPDSTSRSLLTERAEPPRPFVDPGEPQVREAARGLGLYLIIGLVGGLAAGFAWNVVVTPPAYVMGSNSQAATTERGLTQFFVADAWFAVIGLIGGILVGWLAWLRYGRRGWIVVPLALLGAVAAGLIAWGFGVFLDAGDFQQRMAQAKPGDRVEIDLALKARAAVLMWPFGAIIPVLIGSWLSDDEAGPGLVTRLRLRRAERRMRALMQDDRAAGETGTPER